MPIVTDNAGILWLEPQHLDINGVVKEFSLGLTPSDLKSKYVISDAEWNAFSYAIQKLWRSKAEKLPTAPDAGRVTDVNQRLSTFALALPSYVTAADLGNTEQLLNGASIDPATLEREILRLAINPDLRSVQLHGRFMAVPLFQEFAYIVDSATFAYYRGNIVSAFFAIIPVIEGVLLRWQGYPAKVGKKPSFAATIQFLKNTPNRQPLPLLPLFFDSWVAAASAIIEHHLYKKTDTGTAFGFFNRHLALHLLDDQPFFTPTNAQRLFLLLDLLSDIYVAEKRNDPRFYTDEKARATHREAYLRTIEASLHPNEPEHLLFRTHPKYKFH